MIGTTDTGWHAQGRQGPQGPQGTQGPAGPSGQEYIWTGTYAQYQALSSYDPNTLYCITDGTPYTQQQADWNQVDTTAPDYIKNKPTIPAAQVQANWNETNSSSKAYIQNKPQTEQWTFTVDDGQGGTTTVTKNIYVG